VSLSHTDENRLEKSISKRFTLSANVMVEEQMPAPPERPIGLSFVKRLDWLCQCTLYVEPYVFILEDEIPNPQENSFCSNRMRLNIFEAVRSIQQQNPSTID
jgi:hypothetical protein